MKIKLTTLLSAWILSLTTLAVPVLSPTDNHVINIAGQLVPVPRGGLYDRYRSNTPLDVVALERPELDLSWFKTLSKNKVDIGFESWSPNFYYQNSRITAVFSADYATLQALLPPEVATQVQPLKIWPGRGLVALTAYSYFYCDNDNYDEIALSIITTKPGSMNLGPLSVLAQNRVKEFWGYVLKLPVNTELARVRGVVGYNLPKWLTGINRHESSDAIQYEIIDATTGAVDVSFSGKKLMDLEREPVLVTNRFTNIDLQHKLTTGHAVARQYAYANSTNAADVQLTLHGGSLSKFIQTLKFGKLMKYEYVPEFQLALYAPEAMEEYVKKEQ